MALKNEAVVESWNRVVVHGAGRGEWVIERIDVKLAEAKMPGVYAEEREVSSGLFGTKRPFLVVGHNSLRDYHMYIGARDFGVHLDVSWYLTIEPGFLTRIIHQPE